MKKYLILIAGSPATGKSYLINEMRRVLGDFFLITPDEGKEILADQIGFDSADEKKSVRKEGLEILLRCIVTLYGCWKTNHCLRVSF